MKNLDKIIEKIKIDNSHQPDFLQAFEEVWGSIKKHLATLDESTADKYTSILPSLFEPERIISFKVVWRDDNGIKRINKGWRIQYNSALGPYKGGLRFDESVKEGVLKFLAYEQIFKNSLTGLFLGGGKGGSDINPKELSESELENFSIAFMSELKKYIGDKIDVPAGDIGVGAVQIGKLYGAYRKLGGEFSGVLTGKGLDFGGLKGRKEATGFGVGYITNQILLGENDSFENKKVLISGSGNVSLHAGIKSIEFGGKVLTFSDRGGVLFKESGYDFDDIKLIEKHKEKRSPLSEIKIEGAIYKPDCKPWIYKGDIALPCATQNEVVISDAINLCENGIKYVVEGANMPLDKASIDHIHVNNVIYMPGKAANAGGVAMSGIEMNQNSEFMPYKFEDVNAKLQEIMKNIYDQTVKYGKAGDKIDFVYGANIAGFVRVADAMIAQGM